MAKSFFDEQQEQSQVKAEIVAKYFNAWTDVMLANAKKGLNRPGFVGGSHFQIGWSRYEQNNEQILP